MMVPIVSFVLALLLSYPQSPSNLIEWNAARKLTWGDFKGVPDVNSPNAALTSSSINIEFGYNNTSLTYSIKCRFNQTKSWGRIKNDYILSHEQGHFDIAELHARKLQKALKAYKFRSSKVGEDVNAIYADVIKEHQLVQQSYDGETDHSRNPVKQQEWEKKIQQLLKDLEEYKNYSK